MNIERELAITFGYLVESFGRLFSLIDRFIILSAAEDLAKCNFSNLNRKAISKKMNEWSKNVSKYFQSNKEKPITANNLKLPDHYCTAIKDFSNRLYTFNNTDINSYLTSIHDEFLKHQDNEIVCQSLIMIKEEIIRKQEQVLEIQKLINKKFPEQSSTSKEVTNMKKAKPHNKPFAKLKTITNEQIISLFPSKAVREYLTKINWQFSDRDREILYRYLVLNEEPSYENDYVTIPFPFRSGDLVHVIGNEEKIGVFCSCKDDKDFFEHDKRIKDFADWSDSGITRVEFLYPDGRFSHEHPYCFDLETVDFPKDSIKGDPYKTALTIASELIHGKNSSIECLQMNCEEYAEKNAKNHKFLRSRK